MNRRLVSATFAMAAAVVAFAPIAASAQPVSMHAPVSAFFHKTKAVSLTLKNASNADITVQTGSASVTVAAGGSTKVLVAQGDKITRADGSIVLGGVTSEFEGATITLK
ncbi:hypothetical protein ACFQBQ_09570 [Granulicella cerasi]|uniref:Uncharacterized protein n=1 Tax=Granulicella cerasi TaxID=741063 RepID=A0ABW1ZAD5_9BACT|nr:hypothetical protein [Granulicella cerasi]